MERDLERAIGRPVQGVAVTGAAAALGARIFRDGVGLAERNRQARIRDHARASIDYLDYQPVEALFLSRVRDRTLEAGRRGR